MTAPVPSPLLGKTAGEVSQTSTNMQNAPDFLQIFCRFFAMLIGADELMALDVILTSSCLSIKKKKLNNVLVVFKGLAGSVQAQTYL